MHKVHKKAKLDCEGCHVADKDGSVVLRRPGHDECTSCHQDEFDARKQSMCASCHTTFPPTNGSDLVPYPPVRKTQSFLLDFSHKLHVDPLARVDSQTHSRADCSFCHKLDTQGFYAAIPGHPECASCHSKPGMKPNLSDSSVTADCRGCHVPELTENPAMAKLKPVTVPAVVANRYQNIKFNHAVHFKVRDQLQVSCNSCHEGINTSDSLSTMALPKMVDCVECHETSKSLPVQYQMTNCHLCHVDPQSGPVPISHTRYIKPEFHNESFRQHHTIEASAPGAKCFVCHTNVSPQAAATQQCISCHQVMLPVSHTARWRDDVHGKYAAIDRESCALCHQTDYCSRCHNELPRSHVPLPPFVNGGHAQTALVNDRACYTCHTYQNTCAECHSQAPLLNRKPFGR
jgi:hypothetical protein